MSRSRNIKPGFYKNEDLAECSVWARFIYPGLWMIADREGRLEDRPKRIKGELLPFDNQPVEPLLDELIGHGFLIRYRIGGASCLQIPKFSTHQSPHYSEKPSVIKGPEFAEDVDDYRGYVPGTLPEHSRKNGAIKRGSQPPDSLIPDSLIPDSGFLNPERGKKLGALASGARLPNDWQLPADWRAWALEAKPGIAVDEEAAKFADYWQARPGALARKANWFATWRNWIRRVVVPPRGTSNGYVPMPGEL